MSIQRVNGSMFGISAPCSWVSRDVDRVSGLVSVRVDRVASRVSACVDQVTSLVSASVDRVNAGDRTLQACLVTG